MVNVRGNGILSLGFLGLIAFSGFGSAQNVAVDLKGSLPTICAGDPLPVQVTITNNSKEKFELPKDAGQAFLWYTVRKGGESWNMEKELAASLSIPAQSRLVYNDYLCFPDDRRARERLFAQAGTYEVMVQALLGESKIPSGNTLSVTIVELKEQPALDTVAARLLCERGEIGFFVQKWTNETLLQVAASARAAMCYYFSEPIAFQKEGASRMRMFEIVYLKAVTLAAWSKYGHGDGTLEIVKTDPDYCMALAIASLLENGAEEQPIVREERLFWQALLLGYKRSFQAAGDLAAACVKEFPLSPYATECRTALRDLNEMRGTAEKRPRR